MTSLFGGRCNSSQGCPEIRLLETDILDQNKIVISTGEVMGLRPTQDDEKRRVPASTLYGIVTLSLSSRPERTRISCHAALDKAACAPFS
jgi:hypothetical protein